MRFMSCKFLAVLFTVIITKPLLAQNLYAEHAPQPQVMTDGKMHIYFCGTGDPQINMQYIRHPACLAIIADNQFMLFDAGEGALQTLAMMGLPVKQLSKVFITHWHSDHFDGLGQAINTPWFMLDKQRLDIYGPYGVKQIVKALNRAYQFDVLYRSIDLPTLLDPTSAAAIPHVVDAKPVATRVFQDKDFTIASFQVNHNPAFPAVGYVVQYKGCKITISGDTSVVPSLATNAENADVLINEVYSHPLFERVLQQAKKPRAAASELTYALGTHDYHSDSWQLAKMATASQVRHLYLTHLVPAIATTADAKTAFTAGMSQFYKGPITVADDRDELILQSTGAGNCQTQYLPAEQLPIKTYDLN